MKTLLFTLCICFTMYSTSHSQTMEGTYSNTWESSEGASLTYTLTLNPDGTFIFESHRIYASSYPSKIEIAKGTWKRKYRLLKLTTEASSEDIDLVKQINENKAKFKAYSARHRKYNTVKPSLKFYKSKVFYAKGMKLYQQETNSVSVAN